MCVQVYVGSLRSAYGKLYVDKGKGRLRLNLRGLSSHEASKIVRILLVVGVGCRFGLRLKE